MRCPEPLQELAVLRFYIHFHFLCLIDIDGIEICVAPNP
jgi:hypothetical protein